MRNREFSRAKFFAGLFIASLTLSTGFGVIFAEPVGTALSITPGAYVLSSDIMGSEFELYRTGDSCRVRIELFQPESHHLADFEGPAIIAGNKIIVVSDDGDNARIMLTVTDREVKIEANDEVEMQYSGMNATFNGTYKYKPAK